MVDIKLKLPDQFLESEPKTLIVPAWRKELWAIELDLLAELDRVCKKYGIKYFCGGGTCLGAVRHKGFIPWDDDIDIVMSRAEYEKLNKVGPTEFSAPYFWQTNETDPGSARGHAQLRNSCTTAILKREMHNGKAIFGFNQGIFIDIFPFDNIPDDKAEREAFKKGIARVKERIWYIKQMRAVYNTFTFSCKGLRSVCQWLWSMLFCLYEKTVGRDFLTEATRELDKLSQRYNCSATKEMAPVSFAPYHHEVLPSYFFEEYEVVDFEFLKVPIMRYWEQDLLINYGKNWREHVVGAAMHSGLHIDVDKSYMEYLANNTKQ